MQLLANNDGLGRQLHLSLVSCARISHDASMGPPQMDRLQHDGDASGGDIGW